MEKAEKQSRNLSHKSFLIILKYIPYILACRYAVSTLGDFFEYDLIGLGYICSVSVLTWLFMLLTSFIFKYCYIHRLPLYYMVINDLLNITDYYIGIPISVKSLLILHLLVIFIFMSLYIYGYVKSIKKSFRVVN
jgi:hypothetical protein